MAGVAVSVLTRITKCHFTTIFAIRAFARVAEEDAECPIFIPAFHAITNATRVTKSHNRARAARAVAMFLRRAAGESSTVGAGRNSTNFAVHAKRLGTPIAVVTCGYETVRRYSALKFRYQRARGLVSTFEPVHFLAVLGTVTPLATARAE